MRKIFWLIAVNMYTNSVQMYAIKIMFLITSFVPEFQMEFFAHSYASEDFF